MPRVQLSTLAPDTRSNGNMVRTTWGHPENRQAEGANAEQHSVNTAL